MRVETGVRVFKRFDCGRMVVSGGAVRNARAEAETMSELAIALGVPPGTVVAEKRARSTRENVSFSMEFLEGSETVYVVSDALHAHRGKRYLCEQQPEGCFRVQAAAEYEPFRFYLLKWPGALLELWAWLSG